MEYDTEEFAYWFNNLRKLYEIVIMTAILAYPRLLEFNLIEIENFKKSESGIYRKIKTALLS
ncbi:hypothetical protein HZB88_01070 [archaeon]|nr:hypothetical protein [archaeon]